MVQLVKYYYQRGMLYRLRSLGERRNMDITVGTFYSASIRCVLFEYRVAVAVIRSLIPKPNSPSFASVLCFVLHFGLLMIAEKGKLVTFLEISYFKKVLQC